MTSLSEPKIGPCAKGAPVVCTIIGLNGVRYVGTNYCNNAQPACPRLPGEDYTKCKTICQQEGHAEEVALALAGENARGGHAYVEGHSYACRQCQEALFGAGVVALSVGIKPPLREPRTKGWLEEWLVDAAPDSYKFQGGVYTDIRSPGDPIGAECNGFMGPGIITRASSATVHMLDVEDGKLVSRGRVALPADDRLAPDGVAIVSGAITAHFQSEELRAAHVAGEAALSADLSKLAGMSLSEIDAYLKEHGLVPKGYKVVSVDP